MAVLLNPYRYGAAAAPTLPLTIPWQSAFWASDPSWSNPGDGNGVSSWLNSGTSTRNATQATAGNQPIYRASVAALNNKPALQFDGSNDFLRTAAFAVTQTQPNTVILIASITSQTNKVFIDNDSGATRNFFGTNAGDSNMRIFAGSSLASTTPAGGVAHFFRAGYIGGSSLLRMDEVTIASGNAGTSGTTGLTIGGDNAGARNTTGYIAFVGLFDGTLSAGQISDMHAWSQSFYGTP